MILKYYILELKKDKKKVNKNLPKYLFVVEVDGKEAILRPYNTYKQALKVLKHFEHLLGEVKNEENRQSKLEI